MLTIKIPNMAKTDHHSPSPPRSSPSPSASSSDKTTSSSSYSSSSSSSSSDDEQPSSEIKTQEEEEGELQPVENGKMSSLQHVNQPQPESEFPELLKRKPRKRDRSLFKRIWSLPDEIAILKGMVEYQSLYGTVPCTATAIGDFHDSIAKSLSITVNNSQLVDKIRRLRKRYCFANTRCKNGEAPRFSKFHNQAVYDLSKKVWGNEGEEREVRSTATKNRIEIMRRYCPLLAEAVEGTGNKAAGELLEVMEPVRARDLEGKLRRRKLEGMKHHMWKMELQRETFRLVMEGVERSTH